MKINRLDMTNFMLFESLDISWSRKVNVICGGNSTGKTALLKVMYTVLKALDSSPAVQTKDTQDQPFVNKFVGCFRPDEGAVGRLVRRKQGQNRADIKLTFDNETFMSLSFGTRSEKHMEVKGTAFENKRSGSQTAVYLPPKEIISATENFNSLYEEYHIAFEETYYDLSKLLSRPLKRGPNTGDQNRILDKFGGIIGGTITQKENKFYLKIPEGGEFEMGLVSEGYRKLATIMYLVQSGALGSDSTLFWDEPETNMNPKMIEPIVQAILELAKMGVQVFITTHDYFVQQYFNLYAQYQSDEKGSIQFTTLYKDEKEGVMRAESADSVSDLQYNSIMEEFDAIYDREQGMIYDHIGKRNSDHLS